MPDLARLRLAPLRPDRLRLALRCALAGLFALLVAACASSGPSPLPAGAAAYEAIPEKVDNGESAEKILAGDKLSIKVLYEPDLTSENYVVDPVGYLRFPLVGEIIAAGMTPRELGEELTRRLGSRYIRNPDVTVSVIARSRGSYTVEGDVNSPGTFEAAGNSTLLSALAEAKSPTRTAKLDEVMVFRIVNGRRTGGRFNLSDIRRGRSPDPQILAGDTVVVGNSAVKSAWRDFLAAAPLIGIFTQF